MQQSMRIAKLGKVGLCFIAGCFIKPFKMIILSSSIPLFVHNIFISFVNLYAAQFLHFDIRITQEISIREIGNSKLLIMANCNIHLRSNFNLSLINVT